MRFPDPPKPFLSVKVKTLQLTPDLCALCAGYEGQKWRVEGFARHAMEWLPEFCFPAKELQTIQSGNMVSFLKKAAQIVYQTGKYDKRGEFGELFLHIALRQVHQSVPAITKIFYKDAVNNTVKGFDAVHVVAVGGKLELWLGEAKFYKKAEGAIRAVIKDIQLHTTIDFMKNEVALIINKLDPEAPHYERLMRLLDSNTSIDEVFDNACIPVLITYDSAVIEKHSKVTEAYNAAIEEEVMKLRSVFEEKLKGLSLAIKVYLFLLPLGSKDSLIASMDEKLKAIQSW